MPLPPTQVHCKAMAPGFERKYRLHRCVYMIGSHKVETARKWLRPPAVCAQLCIGWRRPAGDDMQLPLDLIPTIPQVVAKLSDIILWKAARCQI